MKPPIKNILLPVVASFALFTACKPAPPKDSGKKIAVVSILPQKQVFEQIAGNNFQIEVLLPPGSNHETYEPTPRDMEKISQAGVYAAIGWLDFEQALLPRVVSSNPKMDVIYTNSGIPPLSGHLHQHEGHTHESIDPHIWMSTTCLKQQAANICHSLCVLDSVNAGFYKSNLEKFNHLADSIHALIIGKLKGQEGKSFMIYHPALGYFARDYGLTQICIEDEGKEPSPAHVRQLIDLGRQKQIRTVFISKEFDTKNAETIAKEIGAKIVEFDPMYADWQQNLLKFAELIAD